MSHQFSSDLPIYSEREDQLGRAAFAHSLASALGNWKQMSSLVVALYGDWGSGKSSIKNMAVEHLHTLGERCPEIVEFNPWQTSSRDELFQAFFRDLSIAIGKKTDTETTEVAQRRGARFRAFQSVLGIASTAARVGKTVLEAHNLPDLALATSVAASVLDEASKGIGQAADASKAQAEFADTTIAEIKKRVADELEDLSRPILVILDDVDRLDKQEIRLLMQLIKANADFPNVIYLVLAQRSILEEALDGTQTNRGADFLEKIVQVSFDVPLMNRAKLQAILSAAMDEALDHSVMDKRFDKDRWKAVAPGFFMLFRNLRDVSRFLSSLQFHIALFVNGESFEANPVDLIALEALRVFEPNVYATIPSLKGVLTNDRGFALYPEVEQEATRLRLRKMLDNVGKSRSMSVRALVEDLFPDARGIITDSSLSDDGNDETWSHDCRVCSSSFFDRYFYLAIPDGEVSLAEVDAIIANSGDRESLNTLFASARERSVLADLLYLVDCNYEAIPLANAEPFITSLLEVPLEDHEYGDRLYFNSSSRTIFQLVSKYLAKEPDEAKRLKILHTSFKETRGLFLVADLARHIQKAAQDRESRITPLVLSPQGLSDVQKMGADKIVRAAESGDLANSLGLARILFAWLNFDPAAPKPWVERLVNSREGLTTFLRAAEGTSSMSSSTLGSRKRTTESWQALNKQVLDEFLGMDRLASLIQTHYIDPTAEEHRLTALFEKVKNAPAQ